MCRDSAVAIVVMLAMVSAPAIAQVQMQTDQLDQSASIVRQRMLLNKTVNRQRGSAGYGGVTASQAAACANKSRFRAEYGAGNPKVQRLYSLCRGIGR